MGDYFSWIETPTKTASIELFSQTTYIRIASIYWLQLSSRSYMSSRKFFDTCPPVHLPPVSLSRCRTLNSREIWRWCSSRSWGSCLDSEPSCFPFRKRYTVLLHTTLGIASVAKEYVSYFWHIRYRNICGHFGLYWSEPCLMFKVGLDENEMHEGHKMIVVLGYNAYDRSMSVCRWQWNAWRSQDESGACVCDPSCLSSSHHCALTCCGVCACVCVWYHFSLISRCPSI